MKALVTGGADLIEHHLARQLHGAGRDITALDNLWPSEMDNLPDEIDFIEGDSRHHTTIYDDD